MKSFGYYLFCHEINETDPRVVEAKRCHTQRELGQWFEDFGYACRAVRLGIGVVR